MTTTATIHVSGAEPAVLRRLGLSSNLSEEFGVDFMWASPLGMVGVQRKTFPQDFLSSLRDGRLGKELVQMKDLDVRVLVLEGTPLFTERGDLIFDYGNMSIAGLTNIQFSLQVNHALALLWSADLTDTARIIRTLFDYTQQGKRSGLTARSFGQKRWGDVNSAEFAVYLIESVPGVGHGKAVDIVKALGGTLPITWTGTRQQLLNVDGIGPKTADAILRAFGGTSEM